VAAFAATNLDDLLLLVAWFAAGHRARDIVLGQFAGIGALFAASLAASMVALVVPAGQLHWLGVIPLGFGVRLLLVPGTAQEPPPPATGILAVTAVTVANGADNLGVYIPLFAISTPAALAVYGATFAVMTALWCFAARWLVRHPAADARLRRHGPRLIPWVLVALGLWILAGGL
jgi:cadmium resistance protein CadD (predicted permease)